MKRRGLPGLAYASSAAVYDRADGISVPEDAVGHPVTHYGVHKLANEGTARRLNDCRRRWPVRVSKHWRY